MDINFFAVDLTDTTQSKNDLRIIMEASVAIVHQDLSWTCIGIYPIYHINNQSTRPEGQHHDTGQPIGIHVL